MELASDFSARGKTSAAAVRDYLYQALSGNTSLGAIRTLWLARYLRECAVDCGMAANLDTVLTRQLASRLSEFVNDLRIRLSVESNRRGSTLDDWWDDIRALLPGDVSRLTEGSASWAIAISHFLLHPYSHKWVTITQALAVSSHRALSSGALKDVRLPAAIGSKERVMEAASATARSLSASYGAYYGAMYEVGCMLSAQMTRLGNPVAAYKIRVAASMWDIRAKAAATTRLHTDDPTAHSAGTIYGRTGVYHLTTAPYPAYTRWRELLHAGRIVSMEARRVFPHHLDGPVELAFFGRRDPLFPMGAQSRSRLFRYSCCPAKLAEDIRDSLSHIRADTEETLLRYEAEEAAVDMSMPAHIMAAPSGNVYTLTAVRPPPDDYWTMLAGLDALDAIDTEDVMLTLPQETQDEITSQRFDTPGAVRTAVLSAAGSAQAARDASRDAVV
jgi:hypothetical protein